ncbi:MAG: BrnA antitoxin family protein [Bauldia sp.]|nr:BrnA antitoxin family protein [Bauldia sp.]
MSASKKSTAPTSPSDPDEAPELTDDFFAKGEVYEGNRFIRRGRGRPPAGGRAKEAVNIRLSADVLEFFRNGGPGWQTRVSEVLDSFVADKLSNTATSSTRKSRVPKETAR